MKTKIILITTFFINCFFIFAYTQDTLNKLPEGWRLAGLSKLYSAGVEQDNTLNKKVAFLNSTSEKYTDSEFGTISQGFKAINYLGKRVRYSALIKTSEVERWAGLWFRVDDENGRSIAFDNMNLGSKANRSIKGTNNWKRYEIVLDIPTNSNYILFGFLISGKGKGWIDDIKFEIVDSTVACTGKTQRQLPDKPQNLSFETKTNNQFSLTDYWVTNINTNNKYNIYIIKDSLRNGNVLVIQSDSAVSGTGFATQTIKNKNYLNTKIKITAFIKSEKVKGFARIWLYSPNNKDKNVVGKMIKGTTDWKKYEIIAEIPSNSKTDIMFGVFMTKSGKIWVDDFTFEVIEGTDKSKIPDEPINLTF